MFGVFHLERLHFRRQRHKSSVRVAKGFVAVGVTLLRCSIGTPVSKVLLMARCESPSRCRTVRPELRRADSQNSRCLYSCIRIVATPHSHCCLSRLRTSIAHRPMRPTQWLRIATPACSQCGLPGEQCRMNTVRNSLLARFPVLSCVSCRSRPFQQTPHAWASLHPRQDPAALHAATWTLSRR